jgi:hypothetical protein
VADDARSVGASSSDTEEEDMSQVEHQTDAARYVPRINRMHRTAETVKKISMAVIALMVLGAVFNMGFLLFGAVPDAGRVPWPVVTGMVLLSAAMLATLPTVFLQFTLRCPRCGKWIRLQWGWHLPVFCSRCALELGETPE